MLTDNKIDPRYAVVAGACLMQFMIVGLMFSYSIFFKTFEDEFGWSRTVLSAAMSLAFLVMGVLAGVMGHLGDRFGPRVVLSVTGVAYGLGFALISQISEPWQLFLIVGIFIGLGLSTHDVVTLSTVARCFDKRRGMMTGVVKTGTAAGQMALPLLAAFLIASYDWRTAIWTLGVVAACSLVIAAFLVGLPVKPAGSNVDAGGPSTGLAAALKSRVFWTLCAIQFLFFPSLTTIPLHLPVFGMDLGMSTSRAATLLSVIAGASVLGRLVIGTFSDRIGGRRGFMLCLLPLTGGLLAFSVIDTRTALFVAALAYGFAHGGLFTIVAPTVAEYFGTRSVGAIFGGIVFFGTVGGAIGPVLAGRVFDVTGSYVIAFLTLASMATLALLLVVSLPRKAKDGGMTNTAASYEQ
ncbi:MAG: MFS transporter [Pseudomonadota bacterium]